MRANLTTNITTGAVTSGGSAWKPPVIIYGEDLTLAFEMVKTVNGVEVGAPLEIVSTQVSVGEIDARPAGGTFKLQIGTGLSTVSNTTEELQHNSSAAAMRAAINALTAVTAVYGQVAVQEKDGSWWLVFAEAGVVTPVPLQVRENELHPVTLYEVNAWTFNERIVHELRLKQAPLAFIDVAERVLPDPPAVTSLRDGSVTGDGSHASSEIQQLFVTPDFGGSYYLVRETGARTSALSRDDDETVIQPALEEIYGEGNIKVTLADEYTYQIAFVGSLIGINWPLLTVTPVAEPPGPLTATLNFKGYPLTRVLRAKEIVTVPIEVRAVVQVTEETTEEIVLLQEALTIRRPGTWEGLALAPNIDWLVPPARINRIPFNRTQVITGHTFSPPIILGDDAATVFEVAHGLDSDTVLYQLRENADGGAGLVLGTDYAVTIDSDNQLTVTALTGAPAEDAWVLLLMSSKTVSAFAEGLTLEQGQVVGLEDRLEALETSLATLQEQAATAPLGLVSTTTASAPIVIRLEDRQDAYPVVGGKIEQAGGVIDLEKLPRGGWLLPAIHDAAVTSVGSLAAMPTIAAAAGNVYSNGTGAAITLAGAGGMRSSSVAVGGLFGGDGRRIYPMVRKGTTSSYFPRDFERTIREFIVPAEAMRAASMLALDFKLSTRLIGGTSGLQYIAVVEHGTTTQTSSPGTTGENLEEEAWSATPLLSARLLLTDSEIEWPLGVEVIRKANGDMAANQIKYGKRSVAGSVPAVGDLGLRIRLVNADPENSVTDATGVVLWKLTFASATISYQ